MPIGNNYSKTTIAIIGGGISGAATAYSLARRGFEVTLYEKNTNLALEGSGNYQGTLYGTFHGNYTTLTELHFLGLHYSIQLIKSVLQENLDYAQSGLIQLFDNKASLAKSLASITSNYARFKQNNIPYFEYCQSFCSEVAVAKFSSQAKYGLYFPNSLWLHPQNLVKKLVNHPNIKIVLNTDINKLNLIENQVQHVWQLKNANKLIAETKILVLCNAHLANQFMYTKNLELLKTRGQTTKIPGEASNQIPLCKDAYILPTSHGYFTIGATFKPNNTSTISNQVEHLENIQSLAKFFPAIYDLIKAHPQDIRKVFTGHAALRCSTKDYLPVVGPLAKYDKFTQVYARLALDKNLNIKEKCPNLPGLYLNVAHGSKGFITAPIAGEIIANYITNDDFIVNSKLIKAIAPNRLYANKIIR